MAQSHNGHHGKVVYSQNGYPISKMNIAEDAQDISCYLVIEFCSFFEHLSLFSKQTTHYDNLSFLFSKTI